MINTEKKDKVLKVICEEIQVETIASINPSDFIKLSGLEDFETLNAILVYFQRLGFIDNLNSRKVAIFLVPKIEAHDFFLRGGFHCQEDLIRKNIAKLLLEIESLKPSLENDSQILANISTIGTGILAGLSILRG